VEKKGKIVFHTFGVVRNETTRINGNNQKGKEGRVSYFCIGQAATKCALHPLCLLFGNGPGQEGKGSVFLSGRQGHWFPIIWERTWGGEDRDIT